jgi:hypothetical protein
VDIEKLQQEVHEKRDELAQLEQSLQNQYDQIVQNLCPFKIGDKIEYELGKKGIVEKIYFPREHWYPLEEQSPEYWAIRGKKINKIGKFGLKDYHEVSNKTHTINGYVCKRMSIEETLMLR